MPASPLLLTSTALRRIETDAAATLPSGTLMDRAARSAAARIATSWPSGAVVVLCGPGNNGGDGLVLARMLHEAGRHVKVWALPAAQAGRPEDAQRAWDALPAGLLQTGDPAWPIGNAGTGADGGLDGGAGDSAAVDAGDAAMEDITPIAVTAAHLAAEDVTATDVTAEDVTADDVTAEDFTASDVTARAATASDVAAGVAPDEPAGLTDAADAGMSTDPLADTAEADSLFASGNPADDLSHEPLSTGALFDAPLLDQGRITDGLLLGGDMPRGVIVDALFGIGLTRPLDAQAQAWITWANAQPVARLAIDVPSGLNGDTGAAQDVCLQATHTLTFIADKPGLHTRSGSDVAGTIEVDDLQLSAFVGATADGMGHLIAKADCPSLFRARRNDTHKGSYGTLAVLAGAPGMTGAALLASRAALLTGAGKIFVALADTLPLSLPCDPVHPELMVRDATGVLDTADALGVDTWVAGCGLGTTDAAKAWLTRLLQERPAAHVVLDADALTLLGSDTGLQGHFMQRTGIKVLTPHPLEASRLLGTDTHSVQADRIAAARAIASRYGAWVVLKGAGTVVSSPSGAWRINTSGNPGLATAGTGDVLSGMLGALLAQGLPADEAIPGGVWLHGAAADRLVEQGTGPIGLSASEVAQAARWIRNHG
jgi:hydroxyethylthiazole kinase-like uncharacterized protein yjeF